MNSVHINSKTKLLIFRYNQKFFTICKMIGFYIFPKQSVPQFTFSFENPFSINSTNKRKIHLFILFKKITCNNPINILKVINSGKPPQRTNSGKRPVAQAEVATLNNSSNLLLIFVIKNVDIRFVNMYPQKKAL